MVNVFKRVNFIFFKIIFLSLQPFFKKDTYILFDNLYEQNAECVDTWCVFQYMQKHNIKSYYVIWKENPLYKKLEKEKKLKNIIVLKNSSKLNKKYNFEFFFQTFFKLLTTKVVITSFNGISRLITKFFYKNKYITYLNINHGTTLLKTFVLESGYLGCKSYNKFLVSSNEEYKIFQRYGWKKENLIKIGLPRWDNLKKVKSKQKIIFVMFTWRYSFAEWNKDKFTTPIKETIYYQQIYSLLHHDFLHTLLEQNNIKLIYTFHHSMINQCSNSENLKFSNIQYVPSENISQYIGKVDLFITDYSSLFFDFAFLHTPIIFFRPDLNDTSLVKYDRDDLLNAKAKDHLLFNVCYNIDGVLRNIQKYIKNSFVLEHYNCKKADKLFFTKKYITRKLVAYLENLK